MSRLREDWDNIRPEVANDILELNQTYFSDEPNRAMKSQEEVWATAELLRIAVSAQGSFSLTYRFDWQNPRDDHEVTIYFLDWTLGGSSVDG